MRNKMNKILLIDNKNYQLVWQYVALDGIYLYLINKDNYEDILFVKLLDNDEIEIVKDKDTLAYIIKMMTKEVNTFVL